MPSYYEISPVTQLKESVECFWISAGRPAELGTGPLRILPDGCADIIYSRANGKSEFTFVGAMTTYRDVLQPPGGFLVGVRFHPAAWSQVLHVKATELADVVAPLQELNSSLGSLLPLLDGASTADQVAAIMAGSLPVTPLDPVQQSISRLASSDGRISLDHAASTAGLSSRQFRRRCRELTALSPKLLSRILRFRRAHRDLLRLPGARQSDIAASSGYADESHFIAEFQRFSGCTPRRNSASSLGN